MDRIMERFYYGDLMPSEEAVIGSGEYKELSNALNTCINEFIKDFSDAERERFDELETMYIKYVDMLSREYFIYGFKLSVQMMAEMLGENICNETRKKNQP